MKTTFWRLCVWNSNEKPPFGAVFCRFIGLLQTNCPICIQMTYIYKHEIERVGCIFSFFDIPRFRGMFDV